MDNNNNRIALVAAWLTYATHHILLEDLTDWIIFFLTLLEKLLNFFCQTSSACQTESHFPKWISDATQAEFPS